ncbi:Golgi SNAP receptor complex member 1 [Macrosteles quadrilineatus]|uniref:Golgi SNAP receptor complex member 1 n=1 Tax=Macrosteles quadrilineatus TaxID=74068 RepID=UPI0023E229BA|nr:Golgi SNAP receptor complex member 1 [Macrosteles quadrilineatus]
MIEWEDLRKQARKLENEIDLKLVSFSKLGTGTVNTYKNNESDMEPLLSTEHVFDSVAVEIEQLLSKLAAVNEKLGEIASSEQASGGGAAMLHTLQRHRDILQDYTQEFRKTQQNYRARRERENLLHSVKKDIDSYKNSSGLNRRMDLYMKENKHIRNSERMVDDQISIAVETREHLVSQRLSMKRIQTRIHDLGSRFPVVNSLVQRINLRKRRDSLIIGLVVGICTFLMLLYLFH